ncbi:MAG: transcriptional regulator NrdR [Wenzhouxiangellaceae bacterium]
MHCPFCQHTDTRVIDSRVTVDGLQIRRRRECESCRARFNTYESAQLKAPNVIKVDGTREPFDEQKIRRGMLKALEKRPVPTADVDRAIRQLLRHLLTLDEAEISSRRIGECVMHTLARLDEVAYIRFASIYLRFDDLQAFRDEIERLEREDFGALDFKQISLLKQNRA